MKVNWDTQKISIWHHKTVSNWSVGRKWKTAFSVTVMVSLIFSLISSIVRIHQDSTAWMKF